MQFTSNADGSVTVTSHWTSDVTLTGTTAYTSLSPAPKASNSVWPPTDALTNYAAELYLHVQIGAATTEVGSSALGVPITVGANQLTVSSAGQALTATIPAAVVAQSGSDGLYAIAYLAVVFNDGSSSGTLWANYDTGTNAGSTQPQPPGAPGAIVAAINGNQLQLSWGHAAAGSAPLGGYTLKWGTVAGGPYPNQVSLPISNYPPATTSAYQYQFEPAHFAFDGTTYDFVVQAYDDGTAPLATTAFDPNTISYFPPALSAINPKSAPPASTPPPPVQPPIDPPPPVTKPVKGKILF